MNDSYALVVLAAGMGSRYGGLKQIDPMGPHGETVLDYSVFDAIRAGFTKVIFVIREDFAAEFKEKIGHRFAHLVEVVYAFQKMDDLPEGFPVPEGREKPWGTAHAIRAARHEIDGPFAVINADDFYGRDAYAQAATFLKNPPPSAQKLPCALVGYQIVNTLSDHGAVNRGICQIRDGLLTGVEEYLNIARNLSGFIEGYNLNEKLCQIEDDVAVSMNFWIFPAEFLAQLEDRFLSFLKVHGTELKSECYIPSVIDQLIHQDLAECHVLESSSSWFGVTYPQDKPVVVATIQKLIAQEIYPTPLV